MMIFEHDGQNYCLAEHEPHSDMMRFFIDEHWSEQIPVRNIRYFSHREFKVGGGMMKLWPEDHVRELLNNRTMHVQV